MLQTSVEIVKPGGTGRPALVISARPEPLPPSRSFMFRLPSAFPEPKKYTYFPDLEPGAGDLALACAFFFGAGFFDMSVLRRADVVNRVIDWNLATLNLSGSVALLGARSPSRLLVLHRDFGQIGDVENKPPQRGKQRQPRLFEARVVGHHQDVGE